MLARHLDVAHAEYADVAACLELGAGTGLAGLGAAAAVQVCSLCSAHTCDAVRPCRSAVSRQPLCAFLSIRATRGVDLYVGGDVALHAVL